MSLGIVPAGGGAPRLVVPPRDRAEANISGYRWSEDGRFVYYRGQDTADRTTGIWRVPAAGGASRLVVRFHDRTLLRDPGGGVRVRDGRFYFTLSDQQSDIWMTDVVGSR